MDRRNKQENDDKEDDDKEFGCDFDGAIKTQMPGDKTDDSGDEGKSSCDLKDGNGGHNDINKSKQQSRRTGVFQIQHEEDDNETEKHKKKTPAEPRYVRTLYSTPEICVEFPYDYKEPLEAVPVSNEQKNSHILDMPQSIREHSERLGSKDRSEMFMIKGKFVFEENCKVMIKFGVDDDCDRYLNFYAVVKQDKVWLQVAAERKGNSVHFETKRMEYFYIMSSPVTTVLELTEKAPLLYVHACDPQTKVFFEEGTVQINMQISIKVLPVSKKAVKALKTSFPNPIIENMSPCLSVHKPEGRDFKKNARVQLPFKPSAKYKTLVVRLDDDKAELSDAKLKDNGDGTYTCDVKAVNTCSFVQTSQSLGDGRDKLEDLRDEVLFLLQEAKRCRLLTFHKKSPEKIIRTEIVSIDKESEVKSSRVKIGFQIISETSSVITLRKGQRIRADLRGAIQKVPTSKGMGLFVVFQPHLDGVHMEFPYVLNRSMGTTPEALIQYSSDNFGKKELQSLHFDPEGAARPPRTKLALESNQGFFSEASLLILAKQISADDWYQLGIGLDLSESEMESLQSLHDKGQADKGQAARDNLIYIILAAWSKKSKLSGQDKYHQLLSVLKDCVSKNVIDRVDKVYKEGRCLRNSAVKISAVFVKDLEDYVKEDKRQLTNIRFILE
ncbi:hypothetical protein CHS0354_031128 [Potamilus streckersoni]|uniref:Death domain-containing protein n=1 Tax=Potamilus streckersoni TaxID=2493646 RepID=A0AAE0TBR5_9BIVA|nr:hypothetical protein CHS0354_031128 [Potamilus streckersoni]